MLEPSRFVYIVDRYLEVSNVYHQRMYEDPAIELETKTIKNRIGKLVGLVESAAMQQPSISIKEIPLGNEKGQIVAPTEEFLKNVERRQEDVLRRLGNMPKSGLLPRNLNRLEALLQLDAREFLGSFPSPSYASDVLSELASLTVCPDVKILAARDLIHMHSVELQLHLARVIGQVRLLSPGSEVSVNCQFSVEQLQLLSRENMLVDKLIEFSVPREPSKLLEELYPLVEGPKAANKWLEEHQQLVLSRLEQESRWFPDTLEEIESFESAFEICDTLVLYGLIATYAAWYSCASANREEMGSFRTNILFCTRILLDERRWEVCRKFAEIALDAMKALNEKTGVDVQQGTGMITANLFFARRMCGEKLADIETEVQAWTIENLHKRYHFLKAILLEDFGAAADLARDLLNPSEEIGTPDMCLQELQEWPILEDFRKSDPGHEILSTNK